MSSNRAGMANRGEGRKYHIDSSGTLKHLFGYFIKPFAFVHGRLLASGILRSA
jgi:hypothetical protein